MTAASLGNAETMNLSALDIDIDIDIGDQVTGWDEIRNDDDGAGSTFHIATRSQDDRWKPAESARQAGRCLLGCSARAAVRAGRTDSNLMQRFSR